MPELEGWKAVPPGFEILQGYRQLQYDLDEYRVVQHPLISPWSKVDARLHLYITTPAARIPVTVIEFSEHYGKIYGENLIFRRPLLAPPLPDPNIPDDDATDSEPTANATN